MGGFQQFFPCFSPFFPLFPGRSDEVKCHKPVPVCTDMKIHVCNFSLKTVALEKVLKKFRGG